MSKRISENRIGNQPATIAVPSRAEIRSQMAVRRKLLPLVSGKPHIEALRQIRQNYRVTFTSSVPTDDSPFAKLHKLAWNRQIPPRAW